MEEKPASGVKRGAYRVTTWPLLGAQVIGDRLLPAQFEIRYEIGSGGPVVAVSFRATGDGDVDVVSVCLDSREGGRAIRRRDLTEISLADLMETAIESAALPIRGQSKDGRQVWLDVATDKATARRSVATIRAARRESQRSRSTYSEDFLREVARIYTDNLDEKPTAAVARHFGKAHRTAALYVKKAREAGHLGPATKGRAG